MNLMTNSRNCTCQQSSVNRWHQCVCMKASDVCRDKTRPKAWYEPEDLTILPEANALDPSLGEKVQTWFQNLRK